MSSSLLPRSQLPADATAAYTDLNSLQKIKTEANDDVALRKVAKQFESMFVGMLFKGMRQANAVFEEGNMGHSNAEKMYRDMYDQQMSMNISSGRGMGIADMVYRQLKNNMAPDQVRSGELDESQNYRAAAASLSDRAAIHAASRQAAMDSASTPQNNEPLPKAASGVMQSTEVQPSGQSTFLPKTPQEFTEKLLPVAKRVAKTLGLDPLMMIAQAALETGWGKHMVKDGNGGSANNLFNIKADSRWQGESVKTKTLEFREGIAVRESARFRRYESIEKSVQDFVDFIQQNPRYQNALQHSQDGHRFIDALQGAGYATDPHYADKIKAVYQKVKVISGEAQSPAPVEMTIPARDNELEGVNKKPVQAAS
ncbi:MAG TPA: flagellar assembly peptidoglycan hydrolase FlgJ [Marinagarivorans sp.]